MAAVVLSRAVNPAVSRPVREAAGRRRPSPLLARVISAGYADLAAVVALVPAVWFPGRWPGVTVFSLFVFPVLWLARWRLNGQLTGRTGAEAPLFYVLAATCVAAVPVVDWQLALPKLLGMAQGAAALVAVSVCVTSRRALTWALLVAAGLALLVSGTGLVATEWISGKLWLPLAGVYTHLPLLVHGEVANASEGAIQPNELAGVLDLVVPLLLAQSLARADSRLDSGRRWLGLAAGVVSLSVLVLTQSRSGLAGCAASLGILGGIVIWRIVRGLPIPFRYGARAGYVLAMAIATWIGWRMLVSWATSNTSSIVLDTFSGRQELWNRAYYMLRDFPFTGIGLGQFNIVLHALYPTFLARPDTFVPHAHDLYLEYALELGIPGAVACAALLVAVLRRCASAAACGNPLQRWSALGTTLSLFAFGVYGLTDAIAPGARAGLMLWLLLGLGAALPAAQGLSDRVVRILSAARRSFVPVTK